MTRDDFRAPPGIQGGLRPRLGPYGAWVETVPWAAYRCRALPAGK